MICSQCKTRNPIGNKFCRECGTKLTAPEGSLAAEEAARAEAERLQERVAQLLAEAFAFSERNEPEKGIPLAEEATRLLPTSTSAYALLATLYERTDQERRAIEAMERVVEMNPDSAADREKLEQLRRGVHVVPHRENETAVAAIVGKKRSEDAPPAWLPVAAAAAVTVAVLGVGLSALNSSAQKYVAEGARPTDAPLQSGTPPVTVAAVPPVANNNAAGTASAATAAPPAWSETIQGRSDPFAPLSGGAGSSAAGRPQQAGSNARARIAALPPPGGAGAPVGTPAPRRLRTSGTASAAVTLPPLPFSAQNNASGFGSGGRIAVTPPSAASSVSEPIRIPVGPPGSGSNSASNSAAAAVAPQNNGFGNGAGTSGGGSRGYIRVSVSEPPRGSQPAAAAAPQVPQGDPMTRAQSLQAAGRYREAIGAYRQAISEGASAGEAYQGIGLSSQRLGDEAGARSAYQQAIAAYEAQAASGRGASAAQRGIASCRAALEFLGGE